MQEAGDVISWSFWVLHQALESLQALLQLLLPTQHLEAPGFGRWECPYDPSLLGHPRNNKSTDVKQSLC